MRQKTLLIGLTVVMMAAMSCQKEVNWKDDVRFCGVASITIQNAGGSVTQKFEYGYDSIMRRPNFIRYFNLQTGIANEIIPQYLNDTIRFSEDTYVVVDRSRRIKLLSIPGGAAGNPMNYYYNYNPAGNLTERVAYDGVNEALRTYFTYNNDSLTSYQQDFQGYPLALSAVVSYQESTRFKGYVEYSLVELFPELVLYMPCFQLGKVSGCALKQVEKKLTTGNLPPVSYVENYSGYNLSNEGWPEGFQRDMIVSGIPKSTARYAISYGCF